MTRISWAARDLVGPATTPKLTTLETNIDEAIKAHRHGHLLRTEGSTPIYEAEPLDTRLISITDPLNASNLTLQQHMADSTLHGTTAAELPSLRVMHVEIPLDSAVDTLPDDEDGSVTDSWKISTDAGSIESPFVRPQCHGGPVWYWGTSLTVNNMFSMAFRGGQQRYGHPFSFSGSKPKFGRVWQHGFYELFEDAISETASMPAIAAFDYIIFPYRTWYALFQSSLQYHNYSFDRWVIKKYTTQTFPDSYRASAGTLRLYWQIRHALQYTTELGTMSDLFWPSGSCWQANGVPSYVTEDEHYIVPQEAEDSRAGVIGAQYVGVEAYRHKIKLVPDWSTFENAHNPFISPSADMNQNIWKRFRQQYIYGTDPDINENVAYQHYDWMLPLNAQDNYSFRMLFNQPNDNQLDIYPLSMCGFMVILPYGYLPLYMEGAPPFYGNDIGRFWALAPLQMAPINAKIKWVDPGGGLDYLIPRLAEASPSSSPQYGYVQPYNIKADVMIVGPESI